MLREGNFPTTQATRTISGIVRIRRSTTSRRPKCYATASWRKSSGAGWSSATSATSSRRIAFPPTSSYSVPPSPTATPSSRPPASTARRT
jgi:hypothetical protein